MIPPSVSLPHLDMAIVYSDGARPRYLSSVTSTRWLTDTTCCVLSLSFILALKFDLPLVLHSCRGKVFLVNSNVGETACLVVLLPRCRVSA